MPGTAIINIRVNRYMKICINLAIVSVSFETGLVNKIILSFVSRITLEKSDIIDDINMNSIIPKNKFKPINGLSPINPKGIIKRPIRI
jgi:hypothetical protein